MTAAQEPPKRPRGHPPGRTHTERLVATVTPEQLETYARAAADGGVKLSAWVRQACDSAAKRRR